MKISQMKKDSNFEGFYLIKRSDVRQTRAGKDYLAITFQDDSGEISGNLWDVKEHQKLSFVAGKIVFVKGRREVYHNTPQVNQLSMRLATEDEPQNPEAFKEKSPVNKTEVRAYIEQMVFHIEQPNWQRIVRALYRKHQVAFYHFPAAKSNHHAFESGLAYHTATMLRLAEALCDIYPALDKSLLYAGIMLHDLGKVIELSGVDNTTYTIRGNLIGHIALIDEEITKVLLELGIDDSGEDITVLRHMVLSHHGHLDYGSPVRPRIMEAEMLYLIDNIDAEMMMLTTALDKVAKGESTPRLFALDNRSFYKPIYQTSEQE